MKKILLIVIVVILALSIGGCAEKKDISVNYGDSYKIESDSFEKYDVINWNVEDLSIVSLNDGSIVTNGPGTTIVTATTVVNEKEKVLGNYTITVNIVPITGIVLATNNMEMTEGDRTTLSYTLFPDAASNYGLNWKSADSSVVAVDKDGLVSAVGVGQSTVTVSTAEGIVAACTITVKKSLPNFNDLYGELSNETWCSVDSSGAWISFDTNPKDADGDEWWLFYSEYLAASSKIEEVLSDMGFPSSVYERMGHTTWSQGRQTAETDIAIVSWTYHPDKGLEVLFEQNSK